MQIGVGTSIAKVTTGRSKLVMFREIPQFFVETEASSLQGFGLQRTVVVPVLHGGAGIGWLQRSPKGLRAKSGCVWKWCILTIMAIEGTMMINRWNGVAYFQTTPSLLEPFLISLICFDRVRPCENWVSPLSRSWVTPIGCFWGWMPTSQTISFYSCSSTLCVSQGR